MGQGEESLAHRMTLHHFGFGQVRYCVDPKSSITAFGIKFRKLEYAEGLLPSLLECLAWWHPCSRERVGCQTMGAKVASLLPANRQHESILG